MPEPLTKPWAWQQRTDFKHCLHAEFVSASVHESEKAASRFSDEATSRVATEIPTLLSRVDAWPFGLSLKALLHAADTDSFQKAASGCSNLSLFYRGSGGFLSHPTQASVCGCPVAQPLQPEAIAQTSTQSPSSSVAEAWACVKLPTILCFSHLPSTPRSCIMRVFA